MRFSSSVTKVTDGVVGRFFIRNRGNLRCSQRDYKAAILDYNKGVSSKTLCSGKYFI
ncbi:MAG: hypothetical protein LBT42_03800 [Tannerella sp.]|jgi:hypothetical protein|nr:hypothetical protein [Tannerella sp.]